MKFSKTALCRALISAGVLSAGLAVTAPTLAQEAVFAERAVVVGQGRWVHLYNTPIRDENGAIRYLDLHIKMTPDPDGLVPTMAEVVGQRSPRVDSKAIVAGDYVDTNLGSCEVTNLALSNGRTQSFFDCLDSNQGFYGIDMEIQTGPVDTGHSYYTQLAAAGIDQRSDVDNYFWGIVTRYESGSADELDGCSNFNTNRPVGVQQVGEELRLFQYDTAGNFQCTATLKLPQ